MSDCPSPVHADRMKSISARCADCGEREHFVLLPRSTYEFLVALASADVEELSPKEE